MVFDKKIRKKKIYSGNQDLLLLSQNVFYPFCESPSIEAASTLFTENAFILYKNKSLSVECQK